MGKYKLTREEKDIVYKFRDYSIPFIFKSGKYCRCLQYFEFISFEICDILLKGRNISEEIYRIIVLEDLDYNQQIIKEELDKNSLEYYNLYLFIRDLINKYYR